MRENEGACVRGEKTARVEAGAKERACVRGEKTARVESSLCVHQRVVAAVKAREIRISRVFFQVFPTAFFFQLIQIFRG